MTRHARLVLALALVAALVRLPLLTRQGLWVDEIFSLAIATGHSLEHPAATAAPELGDFVEGPGARSAEAWRGYLRHDEPPAGPSRVLRAVRLSDTSPPLYYLGLWAWTRVFGTSDLALRSFSLALVLAGLPLYLALARRFGGRAAVLPAGLLLALSPPAVYYGTEGRMYALLWLCVLLQVWSAVRLRLRPDALAWSAWSASALAGMLTHYFFVFVLGTCVAWLVWSPALLSRARLFAALLVVGVALAPWYATIPASLSAWRVTGDWLTFEPHDFRRASAALELGLGYLTGAARDLWGEHALARAVALSACGALLLLVLLAPARPDAARRSPALVLLWLGAALAGPLLFDAWRGTYTVAVPRYASAGLPAALLLAAILVARVPRRAGAVLLALLIASWVVPLQLVLSRPSRSWCPLREVARGLEEHSSAQELVLVHSIPSGVLGVARYYRGDAPIAAWVEQLGTRNVPESLDALLRDRTLVHLVRIHEVGATAPVEDELRARAELVWEGQRESARLTHFRPRSGARF